VYDESRALGPNRGVADHRPAQEVWHQKSSES
jgi:hypothetical protein